MSLGQWRKGAALTLAVGAVAGGVALAAPPKAGTFKGRERTGSGATKQTTPLEFRVGGDGRHIYAFDVPVCEAKNGALFDANRVVRPRVSSKGRIKGKLVYDQVAVHLVTHWSVRVSGEFATRKKAAGHVRVSAIQRRVKPPLPTKVRNTCEARGTFKARHH